MGKCLFFGGGFLFWQIKGLFNACVGVVMIFGISHLELAHKKFSKIVLLKKGGPLQYSLKGGKLYGCMLLIV